MTTPYRSTPPLTPEQVADMMACTGEQSEVKNPSDWCLVLTVTAIFMAFCCALLYIGAHWMAAGPCR